MKKLLQSIMMLFLIVGSLNLTSCSKDDDDKPSSDLSKEIIGTWKCLYDNDGDPKYFVFQFQSNGTFNFKDWYQVSDEPSEWEDYGTWSIKDTNLTLIWEDDDPETYKISISGKSLTIYNLEDNEDLTFTKQ